MTTLVGFNSLHSRHLNILSGGGGAYGSLARAKDALQSWRVSELDSSLSRKQVRCNSQESSNLSLAAPYKRRLDKRYGRFNASFRYN